MTLMKKRQILVAIGILSLVWFIACIIFSHSNDYLSLPLTSISSFAEDDPATKRIVIVGAGVAGLTAAKRLVLAQEEEIEVVIVEASSGFGGRVQKDTTGFTNYPLDLGASWVYDPKRLALMAQNSTLNRWLKRKTKAPVSTSSRFESVHIHDNGRHKPYNMHEDTNHLWVDYSWYDFLKDHIVQPALEAGLKIHYNCPVTSVELPRQEGSNPTILVTSACGKFWTDHVIVTASLAVLQDNDIEFVPSLPPKVVRNLHKPKMWPGFKIFLEFSKKFYADVFEWMPEDGEVDFWDYGLVMPHPQPKHILAGYYIGQPYTSKFRKDMTDQETVKVVLQDLDEAFGHQQATRYLQNYKIVHWSNQPYVRGVYSNKPVRHKGGGPLEVWSSRLLLAGEAFPVPPQHNGWVDGASLSGLHAAELVLEQMNTQSRFTIPQELWEDEDR